MPIAISAFHNKPIQRTVSFTVNGAPVNIENSAVYFTAKRQIYDRDGNAVIHKTLPKPDAEHGVALLTLTADDLNLAPGVYPCDIQAVPQSGEALVVEGTLVIEAVVKNLNA